MLFSPSRSSDRSRRQWTDTEDQLLRKEVEAQKGGVIVWIRIAKKFRDRTNEACRKRWLHCATGVPNKGWWSESEGVQLVRGVKQHGQNWKSVANVVGSRNSTQCGERWRVLVRSKWRDTGDKILINAVHRFGRHWKDIQRQHFQGRSKNCIKNRYTVLVRRYQNQGLTLPQPAGTPEPSAYSATDGDEMSFTSSAYDDLMPPRTEVSTPETQHSWPADGPYSGWTSQESFNMIPATTANYAPIHQPLAVNVTQAAQWDCVTTSMAAAPKMPLASSRMYTTVPSNAALPSYDPYTAAPPMLVPTTIHYPGNTARGPTSSPVSSISTSPSYQDPQAMAQFMSYGIRPDPPYHYSYKDPDESRWHCGCASMGRWRESMRGIEGFLNRGNPEYFHN